MGIVHVKEKNMLRFFTQAIRRPLVNVVKDTSQLVAAAGIGNAACAIGIEFDKFRIEFFEMAKAQCVAVTNKASNGAEFAQGQHILSNFHY